MAGILPEPLRGDLPFGTRIAGFTREMLVDDGLRHEIAALLEERGLILFEDVEPSSEMQLALSGLFGALEEIPASIVARTDDLPPGIIDVRHDPEDAGIVEIDGKRVSQWLPWHFDHCHSDQLWRAAVLRPLVIPPEGGLTGFVDGVQMYGAISRGLRERIEGLNVIYTLDVLFEHMRFGRPDGFREIRVAPTNILSTAAAKDLPRAIHPAVWTRTSGEKVLHVSPWMAVGIEHHEDDVGDALLEQLCREMIASARPYFHAWTPTDMLVWDNWRMLHSATGTDPAQPRRLHRATIIGDYGLGYFENGAAPAPGMMRS